MIKLYFILLILFSSLCIAESESDVAEKAVNTYLSGFKEPNSTISFNDSVFYNQLLEKRSLENYDNRFVILHFWATWSMDCVNELISLNKLQKEFRKKPLLVIALSEDFKDVSAIDQYFSKNKIDMLDIFIDKKNLIYKSLNINHIPATYIIDFDGKVIATSEPGVPVDWEDENLKKFLESKVENHHLLPPEYKSVRDIYVKPQEKNQKSKAESKKEPSSAVIIN